MADPMPLTQKISVIGGVLTIVTLLGSGAVAGFRAIQLHTIEDAARQQAEQDMVKRLTVQDKRLQRLTNRVRVLEQIDYKTLSREYAQEIYYANGNTDSEE
jgi:hypothetical protein